MWAALFAITWSFAIPVHAEHGQGLVNVGPAIPPHGFPAYYEDQDGLRLELCLPPPAGNSTFPGMCVFDPLTGPPLQVGGESFYWLLDGQIPGWFRNGAAACRDRDLAGNPQKACDASLTMAAEATFVAEEPVNREQMVFVRLRIRVDTPVAGTYTVNYPFGTRVFEVGEDDLLDGINFTADIGGSNFLDPEQGYLGLLGVGYQVGPYLVAEDFDPTLVANPYARRRTSDQVVEHYIADPAELTRVVGGTHGNVFRVTLAPAEGPTESASTDRFSLMGKLFEDRDYGVHDFGPQREPVLRAVGPVNRDDGLAVGAPSDLRPEGLRTGFEYDYPYGYPLWYADNASPYFANWGTEGIRLTLCIPPTFDSTQTPRADVPADPFCISDPIDIRSDAEMRFRTGGEAFWWSAGASFPMNAANEAELVLGLEATFGGDESIVNGNQIAFGRLRIRVDVFQDGDYRITHPYGVHVVEGVINDPRDGRREINFTLDLGLMDPFTPDQAMIGALFSAIGPQVLISARLAGLRDGTLVPGPAWPSNLQRPHPFKAGATEYFVGNLDVEEPVIGSPYDTNYFAVERKPIGAPDSAYAQVGRTERFGVTGKLFDCDSFQFSAAATAAGCGVVTPPENQAPVAVDDSYTTAFETQLTVAAPGVLGNDNDPDGDTLTAVNVNDAGLAGALTFNANGSFNFTPNAGFSGQTSFTYQASDGALTSDVATVTITVEAQQQQNQAPVAVNDSYTTAFETPLTVAAPGVLSNDSDPDGDTLTAVNVNDAGLAGTLTFNANGSFTFTPNAGFSGQTSFTYQARDGALTSNVATVTITVGAAPNAPVANDDSVSTAHDTAVTIDVLANDVFAGGRNGVTVTLSAVTGGTATVNNQRNVVFTPSTGFSGEATFRYSITVAGVQSNTATVTVQVAGPVQEVITVNVATASPRANNSRWQYLVSGTTTVRAGNRITVAVLSNGQFVNIGTSNVNRNTGAWSVSTNNSPVVPDQPVQFRATSSGGTEVIVSTQ